MIQDNARTRAEDLSKALSSGVDAENVLKHRRALAEIIRNIQLTIEEQRSLINRKMAMSEAYRSVLSDSYAMTRFERLNFDRDIMSKLRNGELPLDSASAFLLFPLTTPELEKRFSLETNRRWSSVKIPQRKTPFKRATSVFLEYAACCFHS